jgi:dihydroflavonol-4-reductase
MANPGLQKGDRVCVTGATGFIGSHVVRALLEDGHTVRATARAPDDDDKTAHLRRFGDELPGDLELVRADLREPETLNAALQDCPFVCHVAASVQLNTKDPQRDIVDVAVEGTRNVLDAVDQAGVARRVVLTSSVAALLGRRPADHVFDEDDWNDSATVDVSPYPLAKTLSERLAWERAEGASWDLVTLNPTAVFGPVFTKNHGRSSPAMCRAMLRGEMPMIPRVNYGACDVRDVARAHVIALERPDVEGRHLINARPSGLREMADLLRATYPTRKIPRRTMPNLGMRVVAMFDKRISKGVIADLGKRRKLSNRKSREALGLTYRDVDTAMLDMAASLIEIGAA